MDMATPDSDPRVDRLAAEMHDRDAAIAYRRDRLIAALTLFAGAGFILAVPFALRAGAEFFLPVTAALVIAVALVPTLEWLERRGVPSPLAAFLCVTLFLAAVNIAIAAIIVPASDWVARLPQSIGRIKATLRPVMEVYASLDRFINETARTVVTTSVRHGVRTVAIETPNSLLDLLTTSAPHALIQMFFAMLVIFFFLSGWSTMRRRTITSRGSFSSAMTTARVIQQVVDATSSYLATITVINICLGTVLTLALWLVGMPTPMMWGGLVALLNYVPYLGPIAAAGLLAVGGLMAFVDVGAAAVPVAIFVGIHLIEANFVTPMIVGRKLTINPLLILVALSFWGWVWGTIGALLAVPLLIILKTVLDAAGKPDIAGFLFEDGMLAGPMPDDQGEHRAAPAAPAADPLA